jgi:hypothetical protein
MFRLGRFAGLGPRLVAGLAVLLLTGGLARADALQFRNDTSAPVIVQGACVAVGNRLVRDRPYLLNPTDQTPAIVLPGNKIITITEAKVPNRVLFQGVIPAGTEDQVFSIKTDGPRVKLDKQRAKRPERSERSERP